MASVNVKPMPARARIMAVFSPSRAAIDVGGLEADPTHVAGEAIRVLRENPDRIRAVGLEDAHRARRAHAKGMEEDHDLADDLLIAPFCDDLLGAFRPDAFHLAEPLWMVLDDIEHRFAERAHQLARVDRADPLDHAGPEILLDALNGGGRRGAQEASFELRSMRAVVDPVPEAWINSPALIVGAWPTTVTRLRWPFTLTRRTQKPLSAL